MSKALEINEKNFEEVTSSGTVLLDFWAEWCGPCKMIGPIVDEVAGEYEGKAVVGKVNVDENPALAAKFGIRNIPTLLFVKNGEVVDKQVGGVAKTVLVDKLEAQL
ncbi:MAG: thioredoxin [Cytophagales bacterium]|nr:thioredoxin [Cytophagales bacterium]